MTKNIQEYEEALSELAGRLIGEGAVVFNPEILSAGRINTSIKAIVDYSGNTYAVLFQKINSEVFPNPGIIDRNDRIIENVLRSQVNERRPENIKEGILENHLTLYRDKKYNLGDTLLPIINKNDGKLEYWRCMNFIDGYTRDSIGNSLEDLEVLRKIGYAFGNYANSLSSVPVEDLIVTIPGFQNSQVYFNDFLNCYKAINNPHDAQKYIEACSTEQISLALRKAVNDKECCDRVNRLERDGIIDEIMRYKSEYGIIPRLTDVGILKCRIQHNDTKPNNILLKKLNGAEWPVAVLDRDTTMPLYSTMDLADGVRGLSNEEETDLAKVKFDMEKAKAYIEGYAKVTGYLLDEEVAIAPWHIANIHTVQGIRFITQAIIKGKYFGDGGERELIRGIVQIMLGQEINQVDTMNKLQDIVYCAYGRNIKKMKELFNSLKKQGSKEL